MVDRVELSRALGKCVAYLACGKTAEASHWARRLVNMLTQAGVQF